MTIEEYFGKWTNVIPMREIQNITMALKKAVKPVCPALKDIFRAFEVCPYDHLKVVVIGQDCYADTRNGKPVATGVAFANSKDTPPESYSPSLKVLMDSFIDFSISRDRVNFDPTLEDISRQGVLFINTALTCETGKPGSHMLLWRPFITAFLENLSRDKASIIYILLGSEAQSLKDHIDAAYNYILTDKHPAYYARLKMSMPNGIWKSVNDIIRSINGKHEEIKWFQEEHTAQEQDCERQQDQEQESEECYPDDL